MRILVILSIILIWIFSLVNDSGWGLLFHTGEKMNWLIIIWSIYLFLYKRQSFIPMLGTVRFFAIVLFFIFIPFLTSGKWEGATYLVSFLTIYCFSSIDISDKELSISAFAIGFLGLGLITIYARTKILSGWNDNAIAMLTLFSFIYFSIFFNTVTKRWIRFICWLMAFTYVVQISETDSRGSLLFMLLAVIMMFTRETTQKIISNSKTRAFVVYFPLILAIIVVWTASQSWFWELNNWSWQNYGKPIFNGREKLWLNVFENIVKYPFGRGEFVINYHNSVVGCIGVFGVVGCALWCNFFRRQLSVATEYFDDYTVYACICAFILIYMQQSIELGFISPMPNMMPYMILGLGSGRVRWAEFKENCEEEEYGKS